MDHSALVWTDDWAVVRTYGSRLLAEVAASVLRADGLTPRVVGDDAGATAPYVAFGNEGIRLMVREPDVEHARAVLAQGDDGEFDAAYAPARPVVRAVGLATAILMALTVGWMIFFLGAL